MISFMFVAMLPLATSKYENTTTVTSSTPRNDTAMNATFGLTGLLVFIIVVVVVLAVRKKCRRSSYVDPEEDTPNPAPPPPKDGEENLNYEQGPVFVSNPTPTGEAGTWNNSKNWSKNWSHLADDIKWMLKGHVIERQRIRLGNVIGKGEFGCVYEATLFPCSSQSSSEFNPTSTQKVAVKTIKGQNLSDESVESFLKEGMIMKAFNHRNVLSLIGVAIDDGDHDDDSDGVPLIVVPFMSNGCLKKYIMKPSIEFTVRELLSFSQQVAQGMQYLSELRFVHRDLATRNCMLDEDVVVKVADFGLSRDLYSRDYYASNARFARLPVRWMAPECLTAARYTVKSDVWSYGVLLWELLTRGSVPYKDISNWDVQPYIISGQRLSQPDVCPDEVYRLMLQCWSQDPADRPNFGQICEFLDAMLQADLMSSDPTNDDDYMNLMSGVRLCSHVDEAHHSEGETVTRLL